MNEAFESEKREMIRQASQDREIKQLSIDWLNKTSKYKYSYYFT